MRSTAGNVKFRANKSYGKRPRSRNRHNYKQVTRLESYDNWDSEEQEEIVLYAVLVELMREWEPGKVGRMQGT